MVFITINICRQQTKTHCVCLSVLSNFPTLSLSFKCIGSYCRCKSLTRLRVKVNVSTLNANMLILSWYNIYHVHHLNLA